MPDHFEKLASILSRALKVPQESIRPVSLLAEDLKADSLDASIAILDIEEHFGIQVPERERSYRTVQDILLHIEELLEAKRAGLAGPGAQPARTAAAK